MDTSEEGVGSEGGIRGWDPRVREVSKMGGDIIGEVGHIGGGGGGIRRGGSRGWGGGGGGVKKGGGDKGGGGKKGEEGGGRGQ